MIEIKHVNFQYKGVEQAGLHEIDLRISDGECVLLCGRSGCGKTTLTRLINGLIPHYYKGELSGEVTVNGHVVKETELYKLANVVGSVFQNPRSQFFSVDTDGEVVFGPENIGLEVTEILRRKEQVVADFRLEPLMGRSLFELSGGEKQKIACASVAALLPEIIILDEPSSNLDWDSIRDLRDCMALWKSQGKTIVISEHRLWYLKDLIDRAVYMEDGRIVHQWQRADFIRLTEEELARLELRPIQLEERFIRQFSGDGPSPSLAEENADESIRLRDFYFTYTPKKYFFLKKKLTPADAPICHLAIDRLSVRSGEIIGVIGKNGSGKSTLLRCLCGLERSCIGVLTVDGKEYRGKELTKECYMVMQDVNHQLFTDSVEAEVLLSMKEEDAEACSAILESLDLLSFKDKHPMSLSGGQKQRVAIASAFAADAELLLFDEPTSGLDYGHMKGVSELLKSLAKRGKTIFVSTHDPELVAHCCDRVVRIERGRIAEVSTV